MFPCARRFAVASLCLCAAGASAEMSVCGDPMLSVAAGSPAAAARICTAAIAAKDHLATCGLTQSAPVTIHFLPRIEGLAGHCAGVYRRGSNRISILPPEQAARAMPQESAFSALDSRVWFDSLVTHEMAHALMDQTIDAEPRCSADAEYVAYAMQIGSLPTGERDRLLAGVEHRGTAAAENLNAFLLFMNPDLFAVLAWRHFDARGNGCAFVAGIIDGTQTLATPTLRR
jgi:hypothetical protein